jgi:ADP-heptose:LPS heptosyltransferase
LLDVADRPARRVVILRALPGLGDLLCATPALRALRGALPRAHVALIGLPATRLLAARFSRYVDELLDFPGYPGLPELSVDDDRLERFLRRMRGRAFDLAIQLHGSGRMTNAFVAALGARATAGFHVAGAAPLDASCSLAFDEHEPEPLRNLRLVEHLGGRGDARLEFPLRPSDKKGLAAAVGDRLGGAYAVLHAGASRPERRWPVARFAAVGDGLADRGLRIVLTGGRDERGLAAELAGRMRAPAIDLTGRTDVGGLAALLEAAAVTVCNDTGVSHLAVAVDAPSVVVFTTSDRGRWAPLDVARHPTVAPGGRHEPVLSEVDRLLAAGRP